MLVSIELRGLNDHFPMRSEDVREGWSSTGRRQRGRRSSQGERIGGWKERRFGGVELTHYF